jgi:hypothetical protein
MERKKVRLKGELGRQEMNLNEFVQKTLEEVTEGVAKAQESCKGRAEIGATRASWPSGKKAGSQREIEFDVAVCVTESSGKGGKVSIAVWGLGLGGGKTKEAHTSTTNRIKFTIPVVYLPASD